ncbi:MAG TPA: hypothetical protein VLH84_00110 [Patescibacteria group bacterium]|nr:hypothetical protein [Patescibacteria group bacterium]
MNEVLLDMYRPVLNLAELNTEAIHGEALRMGVGADQIRMLGGATSKVVILGSGDLSRFLRIIEFDRERADFDALSEYLEEHMPASADDDLSIPTYPFGERVPLYRRSSSAVRIFTLGTDNSTVRQERDAARLLTEEFFGVDGEDTSDAWLDWNYMIEVWLAKLNDRGAVATFRSLLKDQPELLPASISLGKVAIDDGKDQD